MVQPPDESLIADEPPVAFRLWRFSPEQTILRGQPAPGEFPVTYVPHTDLERAEMLAAIGVERTEALFADVPARVRFPKLALPPPCSEIDIEPEMRALAGRNFGTDQSASFLGAGAYHHYRPATVDYVLQRGE